jgi:amidase
VPDEDAIIVERMRAAGALIIGKTNVPEYGYGSNSYNPLFGLTRNAYDPSKVGGGSSGGAGVALALRMLPVADGGDMGGSLRNPEGGGHWKTLCHQPPEIEIAQMRDLVLQFAH